MKAILDPNAIRYESLSDAERVAINVLHRKGVRAMVLAKIFHVGKHTIYGKCITGNTPGYSSPDADKINAIVERLGVEKAYRTYVTDDMVRKVNKVSADHARKKIGRPNIWNRTAAE